MRNLRHWSISLGSLLAVAACSSKDNKTTPDAPITVEADAPIDEPPPPPDEAPDAAIQYDFSCEGQPLPTTAASSITIAGTETTVDLTFSGGTPTPTQTNETGVAVDVLANVATPGQPLKSTETGAMGKYSLTVDNAAATPLDVYLKATKGANRPNYVFPPSAFVADQSNVPLLLFTSAAWGGAGILLGESEMAGNGAIGIAVTDCADTPVQGVTLSIKQSDNSMLAAEHIHDGGSLSAQAAGTYIVMNVKPGTTEITATYGTHQWRAHTIQVFAGATSTTTAVP